MVLQLKLISAWIFFLTDTKNKSRIKCNENNVGIVDKAGKMSNKQTIHQYNLLT